jgi:hypothetical protein
MGSMLGGGLQVAATHPAEGARSIGIFLMVLWAAAMVLFTGDMAASLAVPCDGGGCSFSGLSALHAAMQAILLLAAACVGGTGAALWIGRRTT